MNGDCNIMINKNIDKILLTLIIFFLVKLSLESCENIENYPETKKPLKIEYNTLEKRDCCRACKLKYKNHVLNVWKGCFRLTE